MPGIIRDPKHNDNEEKNFGVVQMHGEFVLYFKTLENDLRYAPAGWKLQICDPKTGFRELEIPYQWTNDITVTKEVIEPISKPWSAQGKMVRLLKHVIEMHEGYLFKEVTRYK